MPLLLRLEIPSVTLGVFSRGEKQHTSAVVTVQSDGCTSETWPAPGESTAVSGAGRPDLELGEEVPEGNAVADMSQATEEHGEIGLLHLGIPTQIQLRSSN